MAVVEVPQEDADDRTKWRWKISISLCHTYVPGGPCMPNTSRQVVVDVIISDESSRSQVLSCMLGKPVHLKIDLGKQSIDGRYV